MIGLTLYYADDALDDRALELGRQILSALEAQDPEPDDLPDEFWDDEFDEIYLDVMR